MLTKEQFDIVENAADDFCAQCAENNDAAAADSDSCKECMIRKLLRFSKPKTLFYHDGRKGWLPEGSLISFHYNDGTVIRYMIHVIDITHVEARRINGTDEELKYGVLTLHHMQLESMIDGFREGIVEIQGMVTDGE